MSDGQSSGSTNWNLPPMPLSISVNSTAFEEIAKQLDANDQTHSNSPTSPVLSPFTDRSLEELRCSKTSSPQSWDDICLGTEKDPELEVFYTLKNTRNSTSEYSRKVFIGGLPDGITAEQICRFFSSFGSVVVDWPHRTHNHETPKGYAFLIFANTESVSHLLEESVMLHGKKCIRMAEFSGFPGKIVQVRPWSNSDRFWLAPGHSESMNPRYSIFLGGVPRTTTAAELASVLNSIIGNALMVTIEVDFETEYPKGAARVVFGHRESYVTAIARRHISFHTSDSNKELEMKPFLEECMTCEMCCQAQTRNFCSELRCLRYFCEKCWTVQHSEMGMQEHRPMLKGCFFGKTSPAMGPRSQSQHHGTMPQPISKKNVAHRAQSSWDRESQGTIQSSLSHYNSSYQPSQISVPRRYPAEQSLYHGISGGQSSISCPDFYGGGGGPFSVANSMESLPFSNKFQQSAKDYSKKVFVGGLPEGIGAEDIGEFFSSFGSVTVDWPHRERSPYVPRAGYAFITFRSVESVRNLIAQCISMPGRLCLRMSLGYGHIDKTVQIRPWCKLERVWRANGLSPHDINMRYSVFLGGVPRTTTAEELALILDSAVGGVVLVSIEVDGENEYPKGAARAVFATRESYVNAIGKAYLDVRSADQHKQVEVKAFLEEGMVCESCNDIQTRHFCPELRCLKYLCEMCWPLCHSSPASQSHTPMQKGYFSKREPFHSSSFTFGKDDAFFRQSNQMSSSQSSYMNLSSTNGYRRVDSQLFSPQSGTASSEFDNYFNWNHPNNANNVMLTGRSAATSFSSGPPSPCQPRFSSLMSRAPGPPSAAPSRVDFGPIGSSRSNSFQ